MADAKTTTEPETITIPVNPNLDPATREDLIRQLAPVNPALGVVGNYADIQRGGAAVLKETGSMSDGVETPPGVTGEDIKAAKKVDAAVDAAVSGDDKKAKAAK